LKLRSVKLQVRVCGFRSYQDRNIGIGLFRGCEEIFDTRRVGFRGVALRRSPGRGGPACRFGAFLTMPKWWMYF
jgi:hypothetical protein